MDFKLTLESLIMICTIKKKQMNLYLNIIKCSILKVN